MRSPAAVLPKANLATLAAPYVSFDDLFERFHYPAGESHLRLRPDVALAPKMVVEADVRGFEALAELVTADRVIRRNGVDAEWFVPYFPFARHDRRNDLGDGFELELALEMVQDLRLTIADPHSEVAGQLVHIPQRSVVEEFRAAGAFAGNPIVIIPDAGAVKKTYSWLGDLAQQTEVAAPTVVQALKHRDPATGQLSGFEVLADDLQGRPCIIVDDICDGGGTFVGLAAQLRAANAGPLTLAVTHGLFTKGLEALAAFDRVFTFAYADAPPAETGTGTGPTVTTCRFQDLYTKGTRQ